jgi:hypothetical protein
MNPSDTNLQRHSPGAVSLLDSAGAQVFAGRRVDRPRGLGA